MKKNTLFALSIQREIVDRRVPIESEIDKCMNRLGFKSFCINVEYANRKASSLSAFCLPSCCCRYSDKERQAYGHKASLITLLAPKRIPSIDSSIAPNTTGVSSCFC